MTVIDEDSNDLYDIPSAARESEIGKLAHCVGTIASRIQHWFGKNRCSSNLIEQFHFAGTTTYCGPLYRGAKVANCDSIVLKYRMTTGSISRTSLYRRFLYQRYITKSLQTPRNRQPSKLSNM